MTPAADRRRRAGRWLALLLLAGGVVAYETSDFGARIRERLTRPTTPSRALGSMRLRRALVRERLISPQPADPAAPYSPDKSAPCPDIELAAGARPVAPPRPAIVASGATVLALALDPCRFDRLNRNRWERGRRWEQTGWVAFYDRGELLFTSAVGVRVHGGRSRSRGPMEVRLYFRESYGEPGFPAAFIGNEPAAPISRLVVRHEERLDRKLGVTAPWISPISFDVARRVGGVAAGTRPVLYTLNGGKPLPYVLVPHIGDDFFRRRFGHEDFELVRGKDREDKAGMLWARRERERLRRTDAAGAASVSSTYDLESFTTWFLPILFCEVGDTFQAVLARDRHSQVLGGRWFLIHWDMDQSFRVGFQRPPPDTLLAGLRSGAIRKDYGPIWELLRWRFRVDPAYPRAFAERFAFAINHQLSAEYLDDLVARNARTAAELGVPNGRFFEYLPAFFRERRAGALAQFLQAFALGASHSVAISAPAGSVRVDGATPAGEFAGRYVEGSEIRLAVEPAFADRPLVWEVDGRPAATQGGELRLRVDRPLRVVVRSAGSPSSPSRP